VMDDDPAHAPRMPMRLTLLVDMWDETYVYSKYANTKAIAKALLHGLDERDQFQVIFTSQELSQALPQQQAKADLVAAALTRIDKAKPEPSPDALADYLQAIGDHAPTDSQAMIPWLVVVSSEPHNMLSLTMQPQHGAFAEAVTNVRERLGGYRFAYVPIGSHSLELACLARCAGGFMSKLDEPTKDADDLLGFMARPTVTQISVDWNSAQVDDVFPSRNLDVFPERPLVLMAHCKSAPPASIVLNGYANGKAVSIPVTAIAADAPGIDRLWARRKMADLAAQYVAGGDDALLKQMTQVAMDHGMVSPFTSILLVDAAQRAPAP